MLSPLYMEKQLVVRRKRSPLSILKRNWSKAKRAFTQHGELRVQQFHDYVTSDMFMSPDPLWPLAMRNQWDIAVNHMVSELSDVINRTIQCMDEFFIVQSISDFGLGTKVVDGVAIAEPCCLVKWQGYNEFEWVSVFDLQHNEAYHTYMHSVRRDKPDKLKALRVNKRFD